MDQDATLDRRTFLRTAGGATAAAATTSAASYSAAASGGVGAIQEEDGAEDGGGDGEDGSGDDESDGGGLPGEGETQTIVVGPDGENIFDPDSVEVLPGTEVVFQWESDNHNVVVDSQPEDASWEGHEPIENTGFEFSDTLTVEGEYGYFCQPHVGQGMDGTITVTPDASAGGEGAANAGPPEVPAAAMSLTTGLIGAIVSVVALTFYFLKYGGTDEE